MIEIAQLLTPRAVRVHLPGRTKDEVLNGLIDVLAGDPSVVDLEGVRRAVLAREEMMSTGVGKGLALPHAKTSAVTGMAAAFATTADPIDFNAIDDAPVRLLFLLVGRDRDTSEHIKTMSRVSRLMNDGAFRERLLAAGDAEAVATLFDESERKLG